MLDGLKLALKDEEEMEDFHDYEDEEHSNGSELDELDDEEDDDEDEEDESLPPAAATAEATEPPSHAAGEEKAPPKKPVKKASSAKAPAKKAAKKAASAQNNRQIALADIMYGGDYDDTICVMINGAYRNLLNIQDGLNTTYGDQRTDGWPLLGAASKRGDLRCGHDWCSDC